MSGIVQQNHAVSVLPNRPRLLLYVAPIAYFRRQVHRRLRARGYRCTLFANKAMLGRILHSLRVIQTAKTTLSPFFSSTLVVSRFFCGLQPTHAMNTTRQPPPPPWHNQNNDEQRQTFDDDEKRLLERLRGSILHCNRF